MQLTQKINKSIEESTPCWLATTYAHNQPNVSQKEVFYNYNYTIIIANTASPQSKTGRLKSPSFVI
ncbi:hypothetical protein KH5_00760 [Urechidicola sp. KH5]